MRKENENDDCAFCIHYSDFIMHESQWNKVSHNIYHSCLREMEDKDENVVLLCHKCEFITLFINVFAFPFLFLWCPGAINGDESEKFALSKWMTSKDNIFITLLP